MTAKTSSCSHAKALKSDELRAQLLEQLLSILREATQEWTAEIERAWNAVLQSCLSSRRFVLAERYVAWLCPDTNDASAELRNHALTLLRAKAGIAAVDVLRDMSPSSFLSEGSASDITEWVRQLCHHGEMNHNETLSIIEYQAVHELRLGLWDVVRATDDRDAFEHLEARTEQFITDLLPRRWTNHEPLPETGSIFEEIERRGENDAWLDKGRDPWFRVNPDVERLTEELSRRATQIAPAFVRELYDIVIEPVPPERWKVGCGGAAASVPRRGSEYGPSEPS